MRISDYRFTVPIKDQNYWTPKKRRVDKILEEEYKNLGLDYIPINKWFIERELAEYENSDFILVPSKFVENTFIENKVFKSKVINFGSYQDSFFPIRNFKKSD